MASQSWDTVKRLDALSQVNLQSCSHRGILCQWKDRVSHSESIGLARKSFKGNEHPVLSFFLLAAEGIPGISRAPLFVQLQPEGMLGIFTVSS